MSPIAAAIAPLTRTALSAAGQPITRAGLRDQIVRLLQPQLIDAAIGELLSDGQLAADAFGSNPQQIVVRLPSDAPPPPKDTLPPPVQAKPKKPGTPGPKPNPFLDRAPRQSSRAHAAASAVVTALQHDIRPRGTPMHATGLNPPPHLRRTLSHSAIAAASAQLRAVAERRAKPAKVKHAPVRASVLTALETAPATRADIRALLNLPPSAVSHHIAWLKAEGLIVRYGSTRSPSGQPMHVWVGATRRLTLPMPTEIDLTEHEQRELERQPESQ